VPLPERGAIEFLILVPVLVLMGPLPEEPAFRGHGQATLENSMTPLAAALLIGIGVVIWHLPVLVFGSIAWPVAFAILAVSVVYAWLMRAGGSVWPLVVAHFSVNYFGGEYLGLMIAEPKGQIIYTGFMAACYVLWAFVIVWRGGPALSRTSR
jgi:uncharacterized protein